MRKPRPEYLTSDEAAAYLGYAPDKYKHPLRAFTEFIRRAGLPRCYRGRRLLFDRHDLDAHVRITRDAAEAAHAEAHR